MVALFVAGCAAPQSSTPASHTGHLRLRLVPETTGVLDQSLLLQAQKVLASRLNAAGLTDVTVNISDSQNLVITVAGTTETVRASTLRMTAPATVRFRKVLRQTSDLAVGASPSGSPSQKAPASPSASSSVLATPSVLVVPTNGPGTVNPSATPAGELQALQQRVIEKLGPAYQLAQQLVNQNLLPVADGTPVSDAWLETLAPFSALTGEEVAVLPANIQFAVPSISCQQLEARPAALVATTDQPITACDSTANSRTKYYLDAAKLVGEDIRGVAYNQDHGDSWKLILRFTANGQRKWADLTREAAGPDITSPIATVLDQRVISATSYSTETPGDLQLATGFTAEDARLIAADLQAGQLPLPLRIVAVEDLP